MSHGMAHGDHPDAAGKRVGALAGVLAIGLTMVTIASHRTHTHAIIARSEANDQWAYFQSKKLKSHTLELGMDLIAAQGLKGAEADKVLQKYASERERYEKETKDIMFEAETKDKEYKHAENQAIRFDLAEGLFEIALVMSSLYFLARKKLFPACGLLGGLAGAFLALLAIIA